MEGDRSHFGIEPLDRLMGYGIPEGAVININGPPGSTLSKLALSFISDGLRRGKIGLLVCFTSIPLKAILRSLKGKERYRPLYETNEPVIMDLRGLDRVDVLIGLIEDGELDRIVLDHPEVMSLRGSGEWFVMLEELLSAARTHGVSTLVIDRAENGAGIGSYVSEGMVRFDSEGGRISAEIVRWDFDPSLEGRKAKEEEVGDWKV